MEDAPDDAEALADRLRRLAERRRVAARRHTSRSSSSEGEAQDVPASRLPQGGAMQALRGLLQERQAALQAAGTELAGGAGAAQSCGLPPADVTCMPASVTMHAAAPGSPCDAAVPLSLARERSASSSSANSPPSMPATARTLISLSNAIEQQEAHAERQARTAEAREAEAAVCKAEVGAKLIQGPKS